MHQCLCANESANDIDLALLEPILRHYAGEPGALIPVLQQAQEAFGYLPRPALAEIARGLGVPYSEVFGVATFYTQFHLSPRGKVIIKICTGTACHVAGASELITAITDELNVEVGKTTDDLRFTIEAVACVGCCGLAPVVVVAEKPHGLLAPAEARKLAKQLLREVEA